MTKEELQQKFSILADVINNKVVTKNISERVALANILSEIYLVNFPPEGADSEGKQTGS